MVATRALRHCQIYYSSAVPRDAIYKVDKVSNDLLFLIGDCLLVTPRTSEPTLLEPTDLSATREKKAEKTYQNEF
jgi:hypothetical protein